MLKIAAQQLKDGLRDAKFIFLSILILVAFLANGTVFSSNYKNELNDYNDHVQETNRLMEQVCGNLQNLAMFQQGMIAPPNPLEFIAEGGTRLMPNGVELNAFSRWSIQYNQRSNELLPALPKLDWSFIVGMLMTLLAFLISYAAVAGEKKSGTLRQVLSNPVSKLNLFIGKFLGLFTILLICFFFGVALNLFVLFVVGGLPFSTEMVWPIAWAILLSLLCISAFLLTGLAVSSLSREPAISLVVLLVLWVVAVFAIPGVGRLVAEQVIPIRTQAEIRDEISSASQQIRDNAPNDAGDWNGDPFAPNVPSRGKLWSDRQAVSRRIRDDYYNSLILQTKTAQVLSSASPYGLFNDSLQVLAGSGIYRFRQLLDNAIAYRQQLYQFVANRDSTDNTTPHLVYGSYSYCDEGVFSMKPVPFSAVPKSSNQWLQTGQGGDTQPPWLQILVLLGLNLIAGFVALVALLRYDPR